MADLNKALVKFGLGRAKPNKRFINLGTVENKVETWPRLVDRLSKVHRTPESYREFMALPRDGIGGQDALKASAGFWIGCPCSAGSRRYQNLLPRTLVSFDMDTLTPEGLAYLIANEHALKNYAWAAHTTRKHTSAKPRLRLVILLSETVPTELYEPVARFLAAMIDKGLKWTDAVSFRPTQLMYLPTASEDGEFEFFQGTGEKLVSWKTLFAALKAKGTDPHDVRNWPRTPGEAALRVRSAKAEDPWEKPGIIGAFCRVFPIDRLIEEHLSELYMPGDQNSTDVRYTAIGSSTSNGLVLYEDARFATSNHGTDPIAGLSVNAWDMARICLYGDLDDPNTEIEITKRPSYKAMVSFARGLSDVQEDMLEHQLSFDDAFEEEDEEEGDHEFFDQPAPEADPHADLDDDDREMLGLPSSRTPSAAVTPTGHASKPPEDWKLHLAKDDKTSEIENTLPNIITIMRFDPRWFGKVRYNELHERTVIIRPVKFKDKPWPNITIQDERNGDVIQDHHRTIFRAVMESGAGAGRAKGGYGLSTVSQVNLSDGIDAAARFDPFHPVKALLSPDCLWDFKERLSTMLQRYLRVEDSLFVREAFTLMMVAAVARTFEPGHKFDNALIIQGKQGAGKSTFLKYLGKGDWHREFDIGFDDPQKIAEKLMGALIVEMGELAGMKRAEVEEAKQFMSATETVVRMAYGREARVFKRRCVFFGTTNDEKPLKDQTGNRRWWIVKSHNEEESGIDDLHALAADVDQCWHEAYHIYLRMRAAQPHGDLPLTLSKEARSGAAKAADMAVRETEFTIMADMIETWADMPVAKRVVENRDTATPLPDDDDLVIRTRFNPMDAYTEALGLREENYPRDAWKMANAFEALKDTWRQDLKKVQRNGVRCKWVYRRGITGPEAEQGWRTPPDSEDDDLIG